MPAVAQDIQGAPPASDTTRLFNELVQLKKEKIALIDSLNVLNTIITNKNGKDSAFFDKKTRRYNVFYDVPFLNGNIMRWTFVYKIKNNVFTHRPDTVFQYTTKKIIGRWR